MSQFQKSHALEKASSPYEKNMENSSREKAHQQFIYYSTFLLMLKWWSLFTEKNLRNLNNTTSTSPAIWNLLGEIPIEALDLSNHHCAWWLHAPGMKSWNLWGCCQIWEIMGQKTHDLDRFAGFLQFWWENHPGLPIKTAAVCCGKRHFSRMKIRKHWCCGSAQ